MKNLLLASLSVLCINTAWAENGRPLNKAILALIPAADIVTDTLPSLKPQFSISNTFTNSYAWRGMVFNEGLMLQPAAQVSYGNWSLGGWSNIVAVETGENKFVPEIDFSLAYTFETKRYGIKPQAHFYFYPSNWENISTLELGFEAFIDMENIGFYVNPNVDVADNYGGVFIDYGIYKTGELNKKLSYDARMLLGWGNKRFCDYYGTKPTLVETNADPKRLMTTDLKSMRLQLTAAYAVTDRFTLEPQLTAFRNFMIGYAYDSRLFRVNAAVTCNYTF